MKRRLLAWAWLLGLPAVTAAETAPVTAATEPGLAYEAEAYTLGYEVYLARGNLAAAFQLARKALRAAPEDLAWRQRYAQVAEWVGQPQEALASWLILARRTDSAPAWAAVARLAPGLLDDQALLAYQQRQLQTRTPSTAQVEALVQTYERLGQARAGMDYLAGLQRRQPSRQLAQAESLLAERLGDSERALALLNGMLRQYGPDEGWLLRRAALRYGRGELAPAWAELAAAAPRMPATAAGFWQTYADLSRLLNHEAAARQAYETLAAGGRSREIDLVNHVSLLQEQDGLAAGRLAESLYRRHGRADALVTALYLYQRERRPDLAQALLDSLSPAQLAGLAANPGFLEQRAQLAWSRRELAAARADFGRALQLAPELSRLWQGLVSVLLEQGDQPALQRLLLAAEARARQDALLWPLWATAWNRLAQPARALPYQLAVVRSQPEDALARLALADSYAALGDLPRAEAWRARVGAGEGAYQNAADRQALSDARLALALSRLGPESGLQRLRASLGQAGQSPAEQAQRRELALSWLLAQGAVDAARRWLAGMDQAAQPLWAQLSLALQAGDRPALLALLEEQAEALPPYDRIEAAQRLDQPALADSLAFAAAERWPEDDEAARRLQEHGSARADWLELQAAPARQGVLERQPWTLSGENRLGQHWRAAWQLEAEQQDSRDPAQLRLAEADVQRYGLGLSRRHQGREWMLGLGWTQAQADFAQAQLGWRQPLGHGLSAQLGLDYQAQAPESTALLVGGMKDQLSLGLNGGHGRSFFALQWQAQQFLAQDRGPVLARGQTVYAELGYRWQAQALEQSLRLVATSADFQARQTPFPAALLGLLPAGQAASTDFLQPDDYRQLGLYWQFGDAERSRYNRAWRPFGELGLNHANTQGWGGVARLGLGGPVLGYDRLLLSAERAASGARDGDSQTQLSLSYRYFY